MSIWKEGDLILGHDIYSKDAVHPDPEKVEALEHLQAPTNKQEMISFLCMMQSNADSIPNFAKKSSKL